MVRDKLNPRPIHFIHNPPASSLPEDVDTFLEQLGGPALIVVDGDDNSRCRGIATLLHGNEPSGAKALLKWLRRARRPAVRVICLLASVQAALHERLFYHRMIPGQRDMNRCFHPPFDDHQGHIAEHFMMILDHYRPEALLDIHNTSGMSPSFGVVTYASREHESLVGLFSPRIIITELRLGALMELSTPDYPIVTIECGGAEQPAADQVAEQGLERFFHGQNILQQKPEALDIYRNARRIEISDGSHIAFADQPVAGADLTVPPDVEKFNFGVIPALTRLGWLGPQGLNIFSVRSHEGENLLPNYLMEQAGGLYSAQQLKLFMVTTNPAIAISDCLFYACAETEHQRASE